MELKKERLEIIIGDPKKPVLHTISTVENVKVLSEELFSPLEIPPRRGGMISTRVKEPIAIRMIRHDFTLKKDEARNEYNKILSKINFEEEVTIDEATQPKTCKASDQKE